MHVDNVRRFVETMETALVAALHEAGVAAYTREGREYTGVWVGDRKIASIGVHLSRGVSTHGFAVNVDNDLAPFEWVVPCGLTGVRMTSVAAETGRADCLGPFRTRVARRFCEAFGRPAREVAPDRLGAATPLAA
jgi:lipoate-protein ligase B